MMTRYWWMPICVTCVIFAVLGQWQKPLDSPNSDQQFAHSSAPATSQEAHEEDDDLPPLTDPVLFEGWAEPDFAIFLSGRQKGYIEPCGCTGLDKQKGGMMRRHTFMNQLLQKGWKLLPIDAGNQVKRFGIQASLKMGKTYEVLCQVMNYQAVGFGPGDLKQSCTEVLQNMLNNSPDDYNPFVSANVVLEDQEFTSRYRVVEIAGKKICVTSVLGDEHHEAIKASDIHLQPAQQAIAEIWPEIEKEQCDYHVLMAFTSLEATADLARTYPYFDILVTCGGPGEPTMVPEMIQLGDHTTRIVQVGEKGMYVGVIGFFSSGEEEVRYQRVPLDRRFKDSETITDIFIDYQEQLGSLGLSGLQISALAHPSGRKYVGSEACYDCHDEEWEIWRHGIEMDENKQGPHWRATLDLTEPSERAMITRHYDPECLSCHVTGWNPQDFFPYVSGYQDLEADELLHGNGCENCHGPGLTHVQAENGDIDATEEQLLQYQKEMRVTLKEARESLCIECHDLDNSPDFHKPGAFDEYWEKIAHGPNSRPE